MREKLLRALQAYAGEDYCPEQDSFLLSLIDNATQEVVHEMHPHNFQSEKELENVKKIALINYQYIILNIAEYHYDKRGDEGALSVSEGGSSVSYENTGTPRSYFSSIVPMCKIIK